MRYVNETDWAGEEDIWLEEEMGARRISPLTSNPGGGVGGQCVQSPGSDHEFQPSPLTTLVTSQKLLFHTAVRHLRRECIFRGGM